MLRSLHKGMAVLLECRLRDLHYLLGRTAATSTSSLQLLAGGAPCIRHVPEVHLQAHHLAHDVTCCIHVGG